MDRMKLLKLQIVIGIITSCIGIVTIMYGVNFYNHPSRGNIVTCIALLFCCMLSIISCVLIVIKNYKNNKLQSHVIFILEISLLNMFLPLITKKVPLILKVLKTI